jgi:hypothetical protein
LPIQIKEEENESGKVEWGEGRRETDFDRFLICFGDPTVADIIPIFLGTSEGGIYYSVN